MPYGDKPLWYGGREYIIIVNLKIVHKYIHTCTIWARENIQLPVLKLPNRTFDHTSIW